MKKICLALCFSLFASLIHAAVMPIGLSNNAPAEQAHHQMMAVDASAQPCHEAASHSQDIKSYKPCHSDSYQCCLGLVLVSSSGIKPLATFTEKPMAVYASLAPQPKSYSIFKPPKS
jgi:hypothetical protein